MKKVLFTLVAVFSLTLSACVFVQETEEDECEDLMQKDLEYSAVACSIDVYRTAGGYSSVDECMNHHVFLTLIDKIECDED